MSRTERIYYKIGEAAIDELEVLWELTPLLISEIVLPFLMLVVSDMSETSITLTVDWWDVPHSNSKVYPWVSGSSEFKAFDINKD